MMQRNDRSKCVLGFTLLELLVAMTIFAIVIGAIYSAFSSTLKLRNNTYAAIEQSLPRSYIMGIVLRDITNMTTTSGLFAGPLIGETEENGDARSDSVEFSTTTGIINDSEPWGDVQKVQYYLLEPEDKSNDNEGYDFVRAVTRNLLASTEEEPEEQRLLHKVQSLEITYYDGEEWQDSWDTTLTENETPKAIIMKITFMPPSGDERALLPIEVLCALTVSSGTATTQPAGEA